MRELEGLDLMSSSVILEQSHVSMSRLRFGAVSQGWLHGCATCIGRQA